MKDMGRGGLRDSFSHWKDNWVVPKTLDAVFPGLLTKTPATLGVAASVYLSVVLAYNGCHPRRFLNRGNS